MEKQNRNVSWTPFTDNLKETSAIVDNEIENGLKELGLLNKAHLFGLVKRRGFGLCRVMFAVLIWPLLSAASLNFFCGNRLSAYIKGGKDVLYDFLKRQNVNWRGWRIHSAKQFYKKHELGKEEVRAATFDDTNKIRRGKKVSAVSSHYDNTLGKKIMGQQVLEMGLATKKGYLPMDSQIYVGEKKVQEGKRALKDKRSYVGKDYAAAKSENKNQMLGQMLKRAIRAAFSFTHVIADSWFGNKKNIEAVVSLRLTGIFRMRRGNLQYFLNGSPYTATELYVFVKRRMRKLKGSRWKTCSLTVLLNLSDDKDNPDFLPVKLLFSAPVRQRGKETWAVFLSTDVNLAAEQILEIYALRWSIEVYFKEIKQNLGFLKEQSGDYAVHYASIHLCAIRYILITHRMLSSGEAFGRIRDKITKQLELLTFARLLWELFKALIYGVLDGLKGEVSSDVIDLIKEKLSVGISEFLDRALQLDEHYLHSELKAEKIGAFQD